MTQYTVTNPRTGEHMQVDAMSSDHARNLAAMHHASAFEERNGLWMQVKEVRDAAARFREALATNAGVADEARYALLDLFQEALDEQREAALDDCAHSH